MSSNTETVNVKMDTLKLTAALAITIGAVIGFYIFAEHSFLYRLIGLLACAGIAVAIAMQTQKGRNTWAFFQATQIEVRKVVWPTRQETVQTTMLVILMVVIVAIILWLLDMFLGWSIRSLMGQGG
ncbi:MAG: preprotein translocase subunit SecE [Gammaproteobacteria bacterium]